MSIRSRAGRGGKPRLADAGGRGDDHLAGVPVHCDHRPGRECGCRRQQQRHGEKCDASHGRLPGERAIASGHAEVTRVIRTGRLEDRDGGWRATDRRLGGPAGVRGLALAWPLPGRWSYSGHAPADVGAAAAPRRGDRCRDSAEHSLEVFGDEQVLELPLGLPAGRPGPGRELPAFGGAAVHGPASRTLGRPGAGLAGRQRYRPVRGSPPLASPP